MLAQRGIAIIGGRIIAPLRIVDLAVSLAPVVRHLRHSVLIRARPAADPADEEPGGRRPIAIEHRRKPIIRRVVCGPGHFDLGRSARLRASGSKASPRYWLKVQDVARIAARHKGRRSNQVAFGYRNSKRTRPAGRPSGRRAAPRSARVMFRSLAAPAGDIPPSSAPHSACASRSAARVERLADLAQPGDEVDMQLGFIAEALHWKSLRLRKYNVRRSTTA